MEKYKLSEELQSIFKEAYNIAKKNRDREIILELILFTIVKRYVTEDSEKECKSLVDFFEIYSEKEEAQILETCQHEYETTNRVSPDNTSDFISLSSAVEFALTKASSYAEIMSPSGIITTEIFLCNGILTETNNSLVKILSDKFGFNFNRFNSYLASTDLFNRFKSLATKSISQGPSKVEIKNEKEESPEEEDNKFEKAAHSGGSDAISVNKKDLNSRTPILDQFGLNMTNKAKENGYDPIIGRDKEIQQVIEVLCCRKKNNTVLLGESGVGKTAIVEGLAQKISEGDVPFEIRDKQIFSISITDLQAGTIYRGQLEERIQDLCNEVRNNKDVIIFIDEFHQAVSEGSSNIAQMLKPALARGEMNMIISTTISEYRKFIEKDSALKRRFEPVLIEEPNQEETKIILRELSKKYSEFHHVRIPENVISKCVEWSGQYITDRQFPDKAIGILDMSASFTKLNNPINYDKRNELMKTIDDLNERMDFQIGKSNFEEASKIRETRTTVEKELENLIYSQENNESFWPVVDIDSVSKVISKISGVPIDKIKSSDMNKLKEMKDKLSKKVIGQDQAVEELTIALQRNILGLRDPHKPIASFLLVGPTGVGKSLVSKVLATEFFGSDKSLVTISCSEYMQDWAESKLLGSAPGYVGFSDTEPRLYVLKRKPYCVLLIDEIEKSSSNLYNIWLNMLEEGEVTLSSGEKVSCRDCIIIFTGNVGTKSLELKSAEIGFGSIDKESKKKKDVATVMKEVKKEFRPEFLNRLSKIIVFNSLEKKELESIFDLELDKLQERIPKYKIQVTKKLKSWIVDKTDPKYGARSLQRLLIEYIEQELCKTLLEKDIDESKKTIKVKFDLDKEYDKVIVTI